MLAVLLVLFVGAIGSTAFRLLPCSSSTGADVSSFTCQFTPVGVYCPASFYCPLYEANQLSTYGAMLVQESGCAVGPAVAKITGNNSYNVLCPCTPGFYCPANTEIPVFCPQGNYCPPSNATTTYSSSGKSIEIGSNGLGAFGSLVYQCPSGTWCPYGQVVPFECNKALSDCPPGTTEPNKTKNWVLLGFIVGFIALCFQISEYIARKERKLQDLSVQADDASVSAPALAAYDEDGGTKGGGLATPLLRDAEARGNDNDYSFIDSSSSHATAPLPLSLSLSINSLPPASASASAPRSDSPSFLISFDNVSLTLPSGVSVMR